MTTAIDEVVGTLQQLRLPHMRRHAPEVLATAKPNVGSPPKLSGLPRRGARRSAGIVDQHPPQSRRVPYRQNVRHLGRDRDIDPATHPAVVGDTRVDRPSREPVVCGPSGTGKSHLLEALGHAAVNNGAHISWFCLEALGALVRRHGADDTMGRAIKRIMRADLICIDDIGLLPVTTDTAEALYRVVDTAYEKRSIGPVQRIAVRPRGFAFYAGGRDPRLPTTCGSAESR
jgi:hypothetical protein